MYKKILQTLGLITIIISQSADSLPFDDDLGHPAPLNVRRACDTVDGAFRLLQSHQASTIMVPDPCLTCISVPRPVSFFQNSKAKRVVAGQTWVWRIDSTRPNRAIAEEEIATSLNLLRREINRTVVRPIPYENDMGVKLSWEMWTDGKYRLDEPLEASVKRWVNEHGGWKDETVVYPLLNSMEN